MRIGITTSVIQRGQTGIAQYVIGLLHGLVRHALDHRFTAFVLEEDAPLFAFAQDWMNLHLVPEEFRPPVEDILWHQRHLPRLARQLGLQVLHVPSYRRMLWRRPCALVATIHDLAPFRVPGKYEWKRMLYGRFVARMLARRQHEIIAVSETTARDVARFFKVRPARVTAIHNGIDHGRFTPGDRRQARALAGERFGVTAPFFLYVARLEHPGKNHVRLIRAFNKFKAATGLDWQLVFAGKDWDGAAEIHKAVLQSPHFNDIRCLGFVTQEDLPLLYRAAEVFLYPSLHEGFGLPPIEAMACGCPVISSPRGSLAEVIGDAAPLVDPEDADAWADQMLRMAADNVARSLWQKAGLNRAKRFDWTRAAVLTLRVYARAIDRAQGLPVGPVLEDALAGY